MGPSININQRKNHRKPLFFLKKKGKGYALLGLASQPSPQAYFFRARAIGPLIFFICSRLPQFFLKKLVMRRLICPEFGHCGG